MTGPLPPAGPPVTARRRPGLAVIVSAVAILILLASGQIVAELASRDRGDDTGDGATDVAASDPLSDGESSATPGGLDGGGAVTDWAEVEIVDVRSTADSVTVTTNASPTLGDCYAHIEGSKPTDIEYSVPCDEFTLGDLWASDTYELRLFREDPLVDGIAVTAETATVVGEVYWDCPQTRVYCQEQGGEPAIRDFWFDSGITVGTAAVGETFDLNCYEVAELITPRGEEEDGYWDYHEGKDASDLMIQVELPQGGTGYIPFVWLVIDPDDPNSLGGLVQC
jgi:hypothetical protein